MPEPTEPHFTPLVELPRRRLFGFAVCGATSAPARVGSALDAAATWPRPDPPTVLIDLELDDLVEPTIEAALAALAERGIRADEVMVRVPAYAASMSLPQLELLVDRGVGVVVRELDLRGAELGMFAGAPIDVMQLPAALVAEVERAPQAASELRDLIGLAHAHDWLTLACAVDRAEQLAALSTLGCDLVCGVVVGPAMGRAAADRTIERYLGRRPDAPP